MHQIDEQAEDQDDDWALPATGRPSPGGPPASRALWTRGLLGDLWGDELPASADPWLTLVQDALALDDEAGRERGFVVYADGLRLDVLTEVLTDALRTHPRRVALLARLPVVVSEPVRRQLRRLSPPPPLVTSSDE